ncbi:hypothetical protein GUJ93_ZPchr0012g20114 [Zizania palustris]|uniref:Uncharacterized protein n=1 Tax=Zizania palustris TaxID=103762 RepID=A0A8J6BVF1_ZIZPA|nr:hypothetical protein GUJ93_ZPchr0012g20114 [Zizania palustris]
MRRSIAFPTSMVTAPEPVGVLAQGAGSVCGSISPLRTSRRRGRDRCADPSVGSVLLLWRLRRSTTHWDHTRTVADALSGEKKSAAINLAEWAIKWQKRGELDQIIDKSISWTIRPEAPRKFGEKVEKCITECSVERPTMGDDVPWNLEFEISCTNLWYLFSIKGTSDCCGVLRPALTTLRFAIFSCQLPTFLWAQFDEVSRRIVGGRCEIREEGVWTGSGLTSMMRRFDCRRTYSASTMDTTALSSSIQSGSNGAGHPYWDLVCQQLISHRSKLFQVLL